MTDSRPASQRAACESIAREMGFVRRLLGFRIVEADERHAVMRFPWFVPESTIRAATKNVERDAALRNRRLRFTVGHRLLRWDVADDD